MIGRTLPYSIVLVGISFLAAFVLGTVIGMVAAWKRGRSVDNLVVPLFMSLGAFPAFFTALLGVYFVGLKLGWFPIQHAYGDGLTPGFNWTFISSAVRHSELPALVIVLAYTGGWVLNMRTVMINTISEDYVAVAHAKGLRDRRVMTRYAGRNAILPPLNGFAAQFATAVGGVVVVEFVFSYPGCRLDPPERGPRRRLPARPGAPARAVAVRDRGELHHGPPELRPRPAGPGELMSRLHVPGWLALLLRNPKSRLGVGILAFMVTIALIAPWIAVSDPTSMLHGFDPHQPPSWQHLFGTTDHAQDVFSEVIVGTRRSLLLGIAAGLLATGVATVLGVLAAYAGGIIDEVINFLINVFLVIPPIPLLVVISGFLKNRGMGTMILALGLVLWAFEARVLRSQALSLKNRDFVLAAKVAGESTWRVVFGELMPNMISRIAAAFVLVFYISLLTDAGLEFLGLGDVNVASWGVEHVLGPGRLVRPAG